MSSSGFWLRRCSRDREPRQDPREPLGVRLHSFSEQFQTGLLELEHQPEGSLHLRHASWWYGPCEIRTVGLRVKETGWVQRANLKAQEYGVDWKAGFPGRHADVRWIVTRHIPCAGADDYRDDQRLAVNGVGRDHQDRSATGLFPTASEAEGDEVNLATANHP